MKKFIEEARTKQEYDKWSILDESGGSSEDQNADRHPENKKVLRRFQMEVETLEIRLEAICVTFW
jgi:hypothetical protein